MDRDLLNKLLIFAAGAAIGSAVTWKIVKDKYECEYVDYVEPDYPEDEGESTEEDELEDSERETFRKLNKKPDIMEYAAKLKELKYASGDEHEANDDEELSEYEKARIREEDEMYAEKEEDSMSDEPYVISEEEFDDNCYDTETLTYYADGVLTDWYNDIIENPENTVGKDVLENFDKYADGDTVYVRNDNHMTDYEILRDRRKYADVVQNESTED